MAFRRLPGRGLTFARPLGLLVAAYPIWLLSSLHVVRYGTAAALGGVLFAAALAAAVLLCHRDLGSLAGDSPPERAAALRVLLAGEAMFALAFLAVVLFR